MNPFVMVLLAIGGAVVLGEAAKYAFDFHSHQCSSCGHGWQHFGAFNFGDEGSHTCPQCGQVQWWKCGVQSAPSPPLRVSSPVPQQQPLAPSPSPFRVFESAHSSAEALDMEHVPSTTAMVVGRR
jgi:predicted RNA-binding Zn-ribbon protein involved in translation (DUF1610 family)